jgi:predicted transcriptional regulator
MKRDFCSWEDFLSFSIYYLGMSVLDHLEEYLTFVNVLNEFKKGNKAGLGRLPNIYFDIINNLSTEYNTRIRQITRKLNKESSDVSAGIRRLVQYGLAEPVRESSKVRYILTDLGKTFKEYIEDREREFLKHFNLI